jgi:hypothetical protein
MYSELKIYISEMRSALFWDFTQRIMIVSYRCCGTTYRSHIQGTAIEDGTVRLSRNVGRKLTFFVAQNPKRAQISFTPRRKPEITYLRPDFR